MRVRRLADILAADRNGFALIRLGAAVAVLVSHNIGIFAGDTKADPLFALTGFTLGQHAVHVFFILSGVLVSLSLSRSAGLKDYMLARLLRIYPGFAACVLLTALVLGPMVSAKPVAAYFSDSSVVRYIALTLGLVTAREPLPSVFTTNPFAGEVNLSLWTLKYEMLCYVALAALAGTGLLHHRRRWSTTLAFIVGALTATYALPDLVAEASMAENLRRFGLCFSLGALAFARRETLVLAPAMLPVLAVALLASHGSRVGEPVLIVVMAYTTLVLASVTTGPMSRWASRQDLSYGVYLYGWPVAQTILLAAPSISLWALQSVSLMLVVPMAVMSWTFIEKPSLALRSRMDGWFSMLPARPAARLTPSGR